MSLVCPTLFKNESESLCAKYKSYSPGARHSIFPLMRHLSMIKAGEQQTVKMSHIVIISRPNGTHSLVKILVPVVFIFELTSAVLTGCQF